MTWTDEPPTEDGWYWVRPKGAKSNEISELFSNAWWVQDGDFSPQWMARNYQFGPRIPTPEELEAMRLQHDKLINAISASWTALNDAMKLIRKGGST